MIAFAARTSHLLVSAAVKNVGVRAATGSLFHPFLLTSSWSRPADHHLLGRPRRHHLSSSSKKTRDKKISKKPSSGERLVVHVVGNRNTVSASLPLPLPPSPPPLPPSNPTSQGPLSHPSPEVFGVILLGAHKGKFIKNPEFTPAGRVKGFIWNEDKLDWVLTYNLSPKHVQLTVPLTTTTLSPKPKVPPATTPSRP
jgi:hypothetical protein